MMMMMIWYAINHWNIIYSIAQIENDINHHWSSYQQSNRKHTTDQSRNEHDQKKGQNPVKLATSWRAHVVEPSKCLQRRKITIRYRSYSSERIPGPVAVWSRFCSFEKRDWINIFRAPSPPLVGRCRVSSRYHMESDMWTRIKPHAHKLEKLLMCVLYY